MSTDHSKFEKIKYEMEMAERGKHYGHYSHGSLERFHEQVTKIMKDIYPMSIDEYVKQLAM